MSSEEETEDSISTKPDETQPLTAIERFHARKFGGRSTGAGERKDALKIAGAGREIEKGKKLKNHLTPQVQNSIQALVNQGLQLIEAARTLQVKEEVMENMEESPAKKLKATTSASNPEHLTGPHDEARQEQ